MNHLREQWVQRIAMSTTASVGVVYRGIRCEIDNLGEDAAAVQFYVALDEGRVEQAAKIALDALEEKTGGLGTHWSFTKDVALRFAAVDSEQTVGISDSTYLFIPVLVEATYNSDQVEYDPDVLADAMTQDFGGTSREEAEVLLKSGAAIYVQAVHIPVPRDLEWARAAVVEQGQSIRLPFDWQRVPLSMTKTASSEIAYRGLSFGSLDHEPSDAEVISKLRGIPASDLDMAEANDWPVYGQHWTTDPEVARNFALARAENVPAWRHRRTDSDRWGVVLEASLNSAPGPGMEKWWKEKEVRPTRSQVVDVVAHLHRLPALEDDTPGGRRAWRLQETYVRSIPIPEGTWRHASKVATRAYHGSPHEIPIGTILTSSTNDYGEPVNNRSEFNYSGGTPSMWNKVWVSPDMYVGAFYGEHIYEVEFDGPYEDRSTQTWDGGVLDREWAIPPTTEVRVIREVTPAEFSKAQAEANEQSKRGSITAAYDDASRGGPSGQGVGLTTDHPRFFFHITKPENRASIAATGLEAGRSLKGRGFTDPAFRRIYLALKPWAQPSDKHDVWHVDTEGLMLRPDPELPDQWWVSEDDIPPYRLELL